MQVAASHAGQNVPKSRRDKMQLMRDSRVFFDYQHITRFIFLFLISNVLLTPIRAYPIIFNDSFARNEILVWDSLYQTDLIFYLIIVVVIIVLYIFYLYSRRDKNVITR